VADRHGPQRAWERAGRLGVWLALAALVGYPVLRLLTTAAAEGADAVVAAVALPGTGSAVAGTLWSSAAAAAAAVTGGVLAALAVERAAVPSRRWLRVGLLMPVLIPPFVSALSWGAAYGPGGVLDDAVGVTLPGLYGPAGVVAVIAVNALPLAYLVTAAALAGRAEPDLERAARASGASSPAALATVTLPLLRPALGAAAVLCFTYAANSFAVPAVLGTPAGFETMTTRIYRGLAFSADPAVFTQVLVLAVALLVVALTSVAAADAMAAPGSVRRTAAPAGAVHGGAGRRGRRVAAAVWAYVALTSAAPFAALVLVALTRAAGLAPVPANWTLEHFSEALRGPTVGGLGRSLQLAAAAATVLVPLGGLVVALERVAATRRLGILATLTFAIPGSALAIAALLAYGRWLGGSLAIILVAYLGKFWALAQRPIAGAADRLPPDLYRAARASGAAGPAALRTIVVPSLAPALAAAWLLAFLFAFHELPMSGLLYGPGTATLAVVVLNLQQVGDAGVTAALAVLLTLGLLVAAAPLLLVRGART